MPRVLLLGLLLGAAAPLRAAPVLDFRSSDDAYYDAINAAAASQLLSSPMPLLRGRPGDWRFSVSPGTVVVEPRPIRLSGISLTGGYVRLLREPWGAYGALFATWLRSSKTTESGAPHPGLLSLELTGLDGPASYSASHAADATVANISVGGGLTYRVERSPGRAPVTLFGGPFATMMLLRDTDHLYQVDGTYGGGATAYHLDGERRSRYTQVYGGLAVGAAAEFSLGSRFKLVPHLFYVMMKEASNDGLTTLRHQETCGGAPCGDTSYEFGARARTGWVYFPIPGLDLVYRDWGLSVNALELIGGTVARSVLQRAGRGSWPFTIRLTKHFGDYEK